MADWYNKKWSSGYKVGTSRFRFLVLFFGTMFGFVGGVNSWFVISKVTDSSHSFWGYALIAGVIGAICCLCPLVIILFDIHESEMDDHPQDSGWESSEE